MPNIRVWGKVYQQKVFIKYKNAGFYKVESGLYNRITGQIYQIAFKQEIYFGFRVTRAARRGCRGPGDKSGKYLLLCKITGK